MIVADFITAGGITVPLSGSCSITNTLVPRLSKLARVPKKSLIEARAAYTPDAARSVSGHRPS